MVDDRIEQDYLRFLAYGPTRQAELARHFRVSGATVCITIRRMRRDGLVESEIPGARFLRLTEYGQVCASELVRRYELAARWLQVSLELPRDAAEEAADRIEHDLTSDTLVGLIRKFA